MNFSEKAKEVFYEQMGLNNRQIAKRMDNYNENLVSRYMNQKTPSATFVKKIKRYFPELNHIDWFLYGNIDSPTDVLHEKNDFYTVDYTKKLDKIIKELIDLKELMSQK